MSWFRLDDKSWSHAKVIAVGNGAWGALCRLGAYASDHLTDGKIPSSIAQLIATLDETEALVTHGLLHRCDDGSYTIHDYLRYNPSSREVRKLRKERAEAGARGGSKRAAKAKQVLGLGLPVASTPLKQNPTPSRPDPVPSPTPEKKEGEPRAKRAHRLPEGWRPSEAVLVDLRTKLHVEPLAALDDFLDWAASSRNAVKVDWDATFRGWVRRDATSGKLPPWSPPIAADRDEDDGVERGPHLAPPGALAALAALAPKLPFIDEPGADVKWTPKKPEASP